jgi:hypothetical protein
MEKIVSRIKTEGIPWIKKHWLFLIISLILAFSQPLILGIIFLYGLVATIEAETLKAIIQAETTILGFFALVVVYALTSLDNRMDRLEEQIFKVEEKYLDFSDNPKSIINAGKTKTDKLRHRLNEVQKIKGKTVYSALYNGILLIGSLLASILGLGFLGIPNHEWAFYMCSLSAMLFFVGIGLILLTVYDLAQVPEST